MSEHRKPPSLGDLRASFRGVSPTAGDTRSIQRNWDKAESIRSELRQYPPRCIGPFETIEEAQRYAGKVELAAQLLARFWPDSGEEDE